MQLRQPGVLERSLHVDALAWVKLQHLIQQVQGQRVCLRELLVPWHALQQATAWNGTCQYGL
jgi:hypothetical protein